MNAEVDQQPPYERLLRAVGSILDEQHPTRFTLVEAPDGYTLLLERWDGESRLEAVILERPDLLEKADHLVQRRHSPLRGRHRGWPLAGGSYEDTLRSLGFELDDSRARGIVLDEVGNGLLLTYSFADPARDYAWRKEMVRLGRKEVEEMVAGSRDRRQRRRFLPFVH